ncbi:DUF397 domain-containing protein [Streptomyces sp. NPDC049954]|uniref:DUF397 domain-containing protein n=1 Tax=Streptomyces sp. NPDC049954 TaxID=3155779 RepID=UPI0034316CF8
MTVANPIWRASSYCGSQGGDCVEVSTEARVVRVRDSKNTNRPPLSFDNGAWAGLLGYLTAGRPTH